MISVLVFWTHFNNIQIDFPNVPDIYMCINIYIFYSFTHFRVNPIQPNSEAQRRRTTSFRREERRAGQLDGDTKRRMWSSSGAKRKLWRRSWSRRRGAGCTSTFRFEFSQDPSSCCPPFFFPSAGLHLSRRLLSQLEEGEVGMLHPVYQLTCQPWVTFMSNLGEKKAPLMRSSDWCWRSVQSPQPGFLVCHRQAAPPFSSAKLKSPLSSSCPPSWLRLWTWSTLWPMTQLWKHLKGKGDGYFLSAIWQRHMLSATAANMNMNSGYVSLLINHSIN